MEPLKESFWSFTPYAFLHRDDALDFSPTGAQCSAARARMQCLCTRRFTHQRADEHLGERYVYTFVRRPSYYAAFADLSLARGACAALTLLAGPESAPLLQARTGSSGLVYGTAPEGTSSPYEVTSPIRARYGIGSEIFEVAHGRNMDVIGGDGDQPLEILYPLGEIGRKTLRFEDERIVVEVLHPGIFTETLPLLLAGDSSQPRVLPQKSDEAPVRIRLGDASSASLLQVEGGGTIQVEMIGENVGGARPGLLRINAADRLRYEFRFNTIQTGQTP